MNIEDRYGDEISLLDVFDVAKASKRSILLTSTAFLVIAIVFSLLVIKPLYEASGVIKIGQIGEKPIESSAVLEVRLKDESFMHDVIAQHPELFKNDEGLILDIKRIKDTDLVAFKVLSHTSDLSYKKAVAFFNALLIEHSEIMQENERYILNEIRKIDAQIETLKQKSRRESTNRNEWTSFYYSLLEKDEIKTLMDRKLLLSNSLIPAKNTRLLHPIFLSKTPVSPNLKLIGLIAFFAGFLSALLVAFVRESNNRFSK